MPYRLPKLHKHQKRVWDDNSRFKVLVAGRRFGKSRLAIQQVVDMAINKGLNVWYMAPTFTNLVPIWRDIKQMVGNLPIAKSEQNKSVEFKPPDGRRGRGGMISLRSGDSPDNLRGSGLDYVVLDEAAYIDSEVWTSVVYPSLADRRGGALLISTPNGKANWFYQAYLKGLTKEKDWKSWKFPTINNPYIDEDTVNAAKKDMPAIRFQQEFLADFTDDDMGVFRGVKAISDQSPTSSPKDGKTYVAGIDWGRHNDFTVISIFELESQSQVSVVRFTDIGYQQQVSRVETEHKRWNFSSIYVEQNAAGGPLVEDMMAKGLPVIGIFMTNPVKTDLVERLALNIERKQIRLIDHNTSMGEQQAAELAAFSMKRSPGGVYTYSATKGFHDDIVIATMLANKHFHVNNEHKVSVIHNPFFPGPEKEFVKNAWNDKEKSIWDQAFYAYQSIGKGPLKCEIMARQAVKEYRNARSNRVYSSQ